MLKINYKGSVLLLFLFLFQAFFLYGQPDSISFTPFSKGRSLVSLNGAISSTVNNRNTSLSDVDKVLNNYLFEIRLAKVVARNFALGLGFTTEKYSSQQLIQLQTEVLALGPWLSYYFTNGQPGGLFIQGAIYYVNYFEQNQLLAIAPPVDEYAKGTGFAGAIGLGYTYVIFDRVGLEVSMNYRQARIYGDIINNINRTSSYEAFNRVDITFRFGFIVLFNKIKND